MENRCFQLGRSRHQLEHTEFSEHVEARIAKAPQVRRVHLRVPVELSEVAVDGLGVEERRQAKCLFSAQSFASSMEVVEVILKADMRRRHDLGVINRRNQASAFLLRGEPLRDDVVAARDE